MCVRVASRSMARLLAAATSAAAANVELPYRGHDRGAGGDFVPVAAVLLLSEHNIYRMRAFGDNFVAAFGSRGRLAFWVGDKSSIVFEILHYILVVSYFVHFRIWAFFHCQRDNFSHKISGIESLLWNNNMNCQLVLIQHIRNAMLKKPSQLFCCCMSESNTATVSKLCARVTYGRRYATLRVAVVSDFQRVRTVICR